MMSRSGAFPADCVVPVSAPDFLNLPWDKQEETRSRRSQVIGLCLFQAGHLGHPSDVISAIIHRVPAAHMFVFKSPLPHWKHF